MIIFYFILPIKHVNIFPYNLFGIILIILGYLSFAGSNEFKKQDTNIDTFKNPNKLVTDEIYKYSRHPIYLGFAIALLGISIILTSISSFIVFISFVLITDQWYIRF
jgi:protein-S-isoprenylcysteine O-methyltransferase Ste14